MDQALLPADGNRSRRRLVIAGCAASVAVLAVGAYVWLGRDGSDRADRQVAAPRVAAVAPAPPTIPLPTTSAPPQPVVPHDAVAPARPTSFTVAGRGFRINAHVCAMEPIFPLTPPGDEHHTVCWVKKGFGFAPGSNTATSYVLG